MIETPVAPVLQVFPEGLLEVSVTLPPAQKVSGPLGVMIGTAGEEVTVTTTGAETDLHPFTVTVSR